MSTTGHIPADRSQRAAGIDDGLASVPLSDWFRIWMTMRARHLPERLAREIQASATETAVNMFTGLSVLGVVSTASVVVTLLPLDQQPARIWATIHAFVYLWIAVIVVYLRRRMHNGTLTSAAFNIATAPMVVIGGILWGTIPLVVQAEPMSHFYLATCMSGLFCMVGFFWPGGQWPIAMLYAVPLLVSLDVAYYTTHRSEFGLAVALTSCELAMLLAMSVAATAALVRARFETILARDRKQMIQLLMQDYERGGHDWVWETDVDLALSHVPPRMRIAAHGDPRFEEGVSLTELLAHSPEALQHVRENQPFQAHIVANGPDGRGEVRLWGRPHLLSGTCLGYRGVGSDEDAMRRSVEAERTQERLDSMVTLTSGLAHDFNNLLATIMGSVEMATMLADLPADAPPHLQRAIDACIRSRRITSDLSVASGFDVTTEPTVVAVNPAIEMVLAELTPLYPEVTIEFEPTEELWTNADRSHFMRSVRNIAENGCQATTRVDRSGIISVTCEAESLGEGEPMVNIVVTDNGPGIPEQDRARIFEPFYSTRKSSGGTGLGLAVAAGFARQAGGSLSIEPVDIGACLRLTLPSVPAPPTPQIDGSPSQAPLTFRPADLGFEGTFLIVEDDDHVAELLIGLFESFGASATRASTVTEACAHANRTDELACVVCDLVLPDGEGFTVIKTLRAADPNLKAVYMSGFSRRLPATVAEELRCPFVPKPFSTLELTNALRAAGVPVVRRQHALRPGPDEAPSLPVA